MKKILCLLLSAIMIFSCFTAVAFAGKTPDDTGEFEFDPEKLITDKLSETNFKEALQNLNFDNTQLPTGSETDLEELIISGALDDVNFLGMSIKYLYTSTDELNWSKITLSKGDIALAKANLNTYLLRIFKQKFLGDKFLNDFYATKICNFVGHLINPDFEDVQIKFFNNRAESTEKFYQVIADRSGLSEIISRNWCPFLYTTCNYKPLLFTLGVDQYDFPAYERDVENGAIVARVLIQAVVDNILQVGPINYLLDVLWAFSRTYNLYMVEPIKALFKLKLNKLIPDGNGGYKPIITEKELSTFKGLFNLISNNNNPNDSTKLQFLVPPSNRFAVAKDQTELFLYVLVYLNIVGRYMQNPNAVNVMKQNISASNVFTLEEKTRINTIIDGFFTGNTTGMIDLLENLLTENFQNAGNSIWLTFREYLAKILKTFSGLFDRIYNSLKEVFEK